MLNYYLYLTMPDYLVQWYAHECRRNHQAAGDTFSAPVYRYPEPVSPIRGSVESDILETFPTKQPGPKPEDFKEGANLVIQIPSFRHRDPQIYNYLRQSARDLLYECIRRRFKIALWRDVHNLDTAFTRKDLAIQAWMEHHGIEDTETNYFAVLKVYDRADAAYRKSESRKKMKKS